jgi:hypothetical protein
MALPFAPCQTFIGSNKLSCTNLVAACCFRPCPFEVDSRLLTNWLSDVLNGVRGQGELIFTLRDTIQLIASESMEAFLYRTDLTQIIELPKFDYYLLLVL